MRTLSWTSIGLVGVVVMSAACSTSEDASVAPGVEPDQNARIGEAEGPIISQIGDVAFENCQATAHFALDANAKELESLSVEASEMFEAILEVSLFQVDEANNRTLVKTASLHRVAAVEEASMAEESAAAARQRSAAESHTSTVRTGSSASEFESTTALSQTRTRDAAHHARLEAASERAARSDQSASAAEEAEVSEAARAEAAVREHAAVASEAAQHASASETAFVTSGGWGGLSSGLSSGLVNLFPSIMTRSAFANASESAAAEESASLQAAAAQEQRSAAAAASQSEAHESASAEQAEAVARSVEDSVVTSETLARERVTHAAAAEDASFATRTETAISELSEAEMSTASRQAAHSALESEDVAEAESLNESEAAHKSVASFDQLESLASHNLVIQVVFDAAAISESQAASESSSAGASSISVPVTFIGGLSSGGIGLSRTIAPIVPIAGCL